MYDRNELRSALADVRRAYRLLWAFQRRMDDLTTTFSRHLGFRDYQKTAENIGNWAKLPMISYAYLFVRTTAKDEAYPPAGWNSFPRSGDMLLALWLQSDTEFTAAWERNRQEPNPLEFRDAENEARSELHARLFLNTQDRTESTNWLHKVERTAPKWQDQVSAHNRIEGITISPRFKFDLSDLGDEHAVLEAAETMKEKFIAAVGAWPPASLE